MVNDVDRLPWFYKRYEQPLPRVPLPRDLPATTAPAIEVLAGTAHTQDVPLDLAQLSRLLHLSAGVTRTAVRPYATWLFRAAGSAGGRFPLEIYVAVPEGVGLPPGVHWYDPLEHALVQVGPPPPHGGAPTLVVTGVPWRTGWRYRERGFRHVYWDAGTMLGQLLAVADAAGLIARLFTRFPDSVRDRPRRRRRGARVAGGRRRPGRRLTGSRSDRSGCPRHGRCGAGGVPARHRARSGRATATRSGGRGIVAPPSTLPGRGRSRSMRSCSHEDRSAAWTSRAACPKRPSGHPCSRRCAASTCRTVSWCTRSMDSRRVCIGGRTSPLRRGQQRYATSSTGYASTRAWRPRPRSS